LCAHFPFLNIFIFEISKLIIFLFPSHPHLFVPLPSRERKVGEREFLFFSHYQSCKSGAKMAVIQNTRMITPTILLPNDGKWLNFFRHSSLEGEEIPSVLI
jgi:hypothetical protein